MFRKLVANLPFSPGLLQEVSFFARRLKKEQRVRQIGFYMVSLALAVQLFAYFMPVSTTLKSLNNHQESLAKSAYKATTSADTPDISISTSLVASGLIVLTSGFFYLRARVMAKELSIIQKEMSK